MHPIQARIEDPVSGVVAVSLDSRGIRRRSRFTLLWLLEVVLALLVVANVGRIPLFSIGGRDAPILANDVALGGLIAAAAMACAARRSVRLDRVALAALAFGIVGGLVAVAAPYRFGLSGFELFVSLAYLFRWLFYFATYLVVINIVRQGEIDAVWHAFELGVLAFAVFGIVQAVFLPDFALVLYPNARALADWDPQGHRLVSTFLDPNLAGGLILIVLLVLLAQWSTGIRVARWKMLLLFVALCVTLSRSSILAFLVGGAVILSIRGLSRRLARAVGVGSVLLLVSAPLLVQFANRYSRLSLSDASALGRVVSWVTELRVWSDNPVVGIGFNTWGFVKEQYGLGIIDKSAYGIEGGLLFVAALTGLVGLAAYVAMMGAVYRNARAVWRQPNLSGAHRGLAIGGVASMVAMTVHSLFSNSMFFPYLMEAQWVIWGLIFVAGRQAAESKLPVPAQTETRVAIVALA